MKTNYHLRSRARRNNKAYKSVIVVVLIFVAGAGFFTISSGLLSQALTPIWRGQGQMARGVTNTLAWFSSRNTLVQENTALRELASSQEAELASLRSARERENTLLEMMGRLETSEGILASVLVRPPETPYDILVIDVGDNHGVKIGDTVTMPEGPLLGVVSEVSSKTAMVRLHSSDGERTNAVLERHSVPVILMGHGGGGFRITLPREVEVAEGDRILSAGVSSELIGVVGKINMAPTDSFKEVVARGPANIFNLRLVIVRP